MDHVPQINFGGYGINVDAHNVDSDTLASLAREIHAAFSTIGFVYLKNHGISEEKIGRAFDSSAHFFKQPESVKEQYKRGPGLHNHGWCCLERERVNPERQPDYKECYDINPREAKNWPPDNVADGFKDTLHGLYDDCRTLASHILHVMAIGLQFEDPHYFTKLFNKEKPTYTALRSLHYPPITNAPDLKDNQLRCGEHTDYGALTILFQDAMGGLEVFNRQGRYVAAPPIPGSVLVNLGDLMQRWTADKLVSTKHRVLLPADQTHWKACRQSIVCFIHPDADCVVKCIDSSDKYHPIIAEQYIEQRFSDSFKD